MEFVFLHFLHDIDTTTQRQSKHRMETMFIRLKLNVEMCKSVYSRWAHWSHESKLTLEKIYLMSISMLEMTIGEDLREYRLGD